MNALRDVGVTLIALDGVICLFLNNIERNDHSRQHRDH